MWAVFLFFFFFFPGLAYIGVLTIATQLVMLDRSDWWRLPNRIHSYPTIEVSKRGMHAGMWRGALVTFWHILCTAGQGWRSRRLFQTPWPSCPLSIFLFCAPSEQTCLRKLQPHLVLEVSWLRSWVSFSFFISLVLFAGFGSLFQNVFCVVTAFGLKACWDASRTEEELCKSFVGDVLCEKYWWTFCFGMC